MKNSNRGFTLIEIVMVLVLLGILAAVAIPKYFDLREEAEIQTAKAVVAELQARINGRFGELLLDKNNAYSCATARSMAINESMNELSDVESRDTHGFTLSFVGGTPDGAVSKAQVLVKRDQTEITKVYVGLPVCGTN